MSRPRALIAAVAMLVASGLGVAIWHQQGADRKSAAASVLTIERTDLQHHIQSLNQYRSKVLVVNFWATWCPPCREEIPHFIEVQQKLGNKGVQFVGVALDGFKPVADFVQEMGINYPVFIGNLDDSETLRKLGNRSGALPYTLIYDRQGNLQQAILGKLDKERLTHFLMPLI